MNKKLIVLVAIAVVGCSLLGGAIGALLIQGGVMEEVGAQWTSRFGRLKVDGNADVVLFEVEAYSTAQTADLIQAQAYTETVLFRVGPDGSVEAAGTLSVTGGVTLTGSVRVVNVDATGYISATGNITSATVVYGTGLDAGDADIDNVADIALDTISADDGSSFTMSNDWTSAGNTVADLGTVTTVDINGGTLSGVTVDGGLTWGAAQDLNNQNLTNLDIDSGAIDGTVIGASSAAAGTFAALVSTSINNTDGNITNVGDIALDSISSDAGVEVVVNEAGNDEDFRIEATGGIAGALFVEGSSGNVGIGTTGPSAMLSVGASSQFQVDSSGNIAAVGNIISADGELTIGGTGDSSIAGNLGIGTTGPDSKLVVIQDVAGVKIFRFQDNAQTGTPAMKILAPSANLIEFKAGSTDEIQFSAANVADNGIRIDTNGNVGIGTTNPNHELEIVGGVNITFAATIAGEHAFEVDVNANGIGDIKGIDINYTTGAIVTGENEEAILININGFAATGGHFAGLEVLATEGGLDNIIALEAGILVDPILQLAGTFGDMDSASTTADGDVLVAFTSVLTDVTLFASDNYAVVIGDAAKFEEIEFILDTVASNPGTRPAFEFSTGVGAWTAFTPADGTNGFRNTGIIAWHDADIPGWLVGLGGEYLIRITRTQNGLSVAPIEDLVQISAVTEYSWDKLGDLSVRGITLTADIDGAGEFRVGTFLNLAVQTEISVTNGAPFVPTGSYQPIAAAGEVTPTISTSGFTVGDLLELHNTEVAVINIENTGTTQILKDDYPMDQYDVLGLRWNGSAWVELYRTGPRA